MNAEEYQRLVDARRARKPLALDQPPRPAERVWNRGDGGRSPLARVIRNAARQLRKRQVAMAAWQRIARPEWLADSWISAVDQETVIIATASAPLAYELRRQRAGLQWRFAAAVPGVRWLRIDIDAAQDADD